MLTIQDINEVSFRKATFSGYNSDDVDQFIDEVLETVTELTRELDRAKANASSNTAAAPAPAPAPRKAPVSDSELARKNAELQEKIAVLAEQVENYRQEEDSIKDAILSAKRLGSASIREAKAKASATITEANEKAEAIVSDARAKSQAVVDSYNTQIRQKEQELESLKRSATEFRSQLYEMYRDHLAVIEKMPNYPDSTVNPKFVPSQTAPAAPAAVQAAAPVDEAEPEEETIPIPAAALQDEISEEEPEAAPEEEEIKIVPPPREPEPVSEKDAYIQEQFSGVGINLNAYGDIPETLQKEKQKQFRSFDYGIEEDGRHAKFKRNK